MLKKDSKRQLSPHSGSRKMADSTATKRFRKMHCGDVDTTKPRKAK